MLYAANTLCAFHQKACEIRDKVIVGKIEGCVSLQNLIEFYSVITNPKRVEKPELAEVAIEEVRKYEKAEKLLKIQFKDSTLKILYGLVERYKVTSRDIYDLKIAATMIDNGVDEIFTANDSDFRKYPEIKAINLFK